MKKRLIAFFMVLCLVFTVSGTAFAATSVMPQASQEIDAEDNFASEQIDMKDDDITSEQIDGSEKMLPAHTFSDEDGERWGSGSNSTHQYLVGKAITIVNNYSYTPFLTNNAASIKSWADYPDTYDSGQTDGITFAGHFYSPITGTTYLGGFASAKDRLVWWFNDAVSKYNSGQTSNAVKSLGCALHYAADLSEPHHAALQTAANPLYKHTEFEAWVKNNHSSWSVITMPSSSFTWACNTGIADMGHNFALNAEPYASYANNTSTFMTAGNNTMPKAQKNCAAVIYKFLLNVGLAT